VLKACPVVQQHMRNCPGAMLMTPAADRERPVGSKETSRQEPFACSPWWADVFCEGLNGDKLLALPRRARMSCWWGSGGSSEVLALVTPSVVLQSLLAGHMVKESVSCKFVCAPADARACAWLPVSPYAQHLPTKQNVWTKTSQQHNHAREEAKEVRGLSMPSLSFPARTWWTTVAPQPD